MPWKIKGRYIIDICMYRLPKEMGMEGKSCVGFIYSSCRPTQHKFFPTKSSKSGGICKDDKLILIYVKCVPVYVQYLFKYKSISF